MINPDAPTTDVIAPGLRYLFCGINPGMMSAATGYHFARPGNRFWPTLHRAGFTPRQLKPSEERELLQYGCGVTSLVRRPTTAASELTDDELRAGGAQLTATVRSYQPVFLMMLGITAYRTAFSFPRAVMGLQPHTIGPTRIWVLPNPSGLNAHYSPTALAELFRTVREQTAES